MSYYFIVQIKIIDKIEYQKYIDKSVDIFKKYKESIYWLTIHQSFLRENGIILEQC